MSFKKQFIFLTALLIIGIFVLYPASQSRASEEDSLQLHVSMYSSFAEGDFLANLICADTDDRGGVDTSYNWREKGTLTLDGETFNFSDGTAATDRCEVNPKSQEIEMVENYCSIADGDAPRRSKSTCSGYQYGTYCNGGACLPVPEPPGEDYYKETPAGKCEWLFGDCFCDKGIRLEDTSGKVFCGYRTEMVYRFNEVSRSWDLVERDSIKGKHPEWIYDTSVKHDIPDAINAFNNISGGQAQKKETYHAPQCYQDVVSKFRGVFKDCFKQIKPPITTGDQSIAFGECVQKDAGYRTALIECAKKAQENPQNQDKQPIEQPGEQPVGVSSLNFRELAQANAEFQRAEADLDKIKKFNDPRWKGSESFSTEYNSALNEVSDGLSGEQADSLMALRLKIEEVHEVASKVKDWGEFSETLKKIKESELGSYSNLDISTDAVKLFNEYNDLTDKGVSAKDALTKATLDNFGAGVLKIIPVLNAIDLIATTPDTILNTFGVGEKSWVRENITQGIISKFAPSEVIKQTTQIMLENSWSDIGNTLAYAWGKVKNADGVGDAIIQFGMFEDVVIASIPVGIARGISSLVGVGGEAVNYVTNWFTY